MIIYRPIALKSEEKLLSNLRILIICFGAGLNIILNLNSRLVLHDLPAIKVFVQEINPIIQIIAALLPNFCIYISSHAPHVLGTLAELSTIRGNSLNMGTDTK